MNEVDFYIAYVVGLYEMQNQFFQHLVLEQTSKSYLYNMWLSFRIKENRFLDVSKLCSSFFLHNIFVL